MSEHEIVPAWLELHDMNVSGIRWDGDTLTVAFSFGTVYDEGYTRFSYRTGTIVFENATLTNAFPDDWEEDTYVSTGDILVDSKKLSELPVPGVTSDAANIRTRFHFVEWQEPIVISQSVAVFLEERYKENEAVWRRTGSQSLSDS